jgi:sugar transferase (PEP-CTERM/EpsH1 system associated)
MKILFTANRFPYPPYRGDKLKIFHLAKRLSATHELHLITFLQDEQDLKHLPELQKIFKHVHLVPLPKWKSLLNVLQGIFSKIPFQVKYFESARMSTEIERLHASEHFDAVHVQHLRMAQYWSKHQELPRILDLPDAYSLYWRRRVEASKGLVRILNKIEQRRVFQYEQILAQYNLTLVCSREDLGYLQEHHKLDNVQLLPNGVDLQTFTNETHDYTLDKTLLFTGNMDYAPNVDAVQYFVSEIFPIILKCIPDAHFVIAGQRPVKKVQELASHNVTVTGFVKNLADVYKKASVVVAPLRFGAGTQNKVLEAMAMGVPVVSRNIGFNGLNIQSGDGVILALATEAFAEACIELLKNRSLRQATGTAGREVIRTQFDWDVISHKLDQYFQNITHKNA